MRVAALALLVLVTGGCRQILGIPGEGQVGDERPKYQVNVMGTGIQHASAAIVLDMAVSPGASQQITLTNDGPQVVLVPDGATYTITTTAPCLIDNGTGMIDGAPAAGFVSVTRDGIAALLDPGFSAPLGVAFTPSGTTFSAYASRLVQETSVAPTVAAGATFEVRIDNVPQATSGPFPIADGRAFRIDVHAGQFSRPYQFTITNAAPTSFGFGKAASPAASSEFGIAIASDGPYLAVGAPGLVTASGHVYVFKRTGTAWEQQADLQALTPTSGDSFGAAVALHGDTLVVGAPGDDAAYVFELAGTVWAPPPSKIAGAAGSQLGAAIAIDANGYILGAPGESGGVVRTYALSDVTGSGPTIAIHTATAGDRFGASIAVSGGVVVVGAPGESDAYPGSGAAYIFSGASSQRVVASNGGANDAFGSSVATDGTTVFVGAPLECSSTTGIDSTPDNTAIGAGAVYAFSASTFAQTHYLKAPNTDAGDEFGTSLSLVHDVLVVGAPFEDSAKTDTQTDNTATDAGAAYSYPVDLSAAPGYIKASVPGEHDAFGLALALTTEDLVVGLPFDDSTASGWNGSQGDGAVDTGAVHTFR